MRKKIFASLLLLLVLAVSSYFGELRIAQNKQWIRESELQARRQSAESEAESLAVQRAFLAEEERKARIDSLLSDEARQAYQELFLALKQYNYAAAAKVLEQEKEVFSDFFDSVLAQGNYLYNGEVLTDETEGFGLLVNASNTAYFGEWSDGLPNGNGLTLRSIVLRSPRYDLARGTWEEGKLNGEGLTGYCYYEGVTEPNTKEIWKQGNFSADLMNGEVVYRSVNASGEQREWHLNVSEGKTVVDERWTFSEESAQYRLVADNDAQHDYVLDAAMLDTVLWKNMVEWK